MVTMTRTYAARRLLEHGPLTMAQFVAITGWPYRSAQCALVNLQITGEVVSRDARGRNPRARVYTLRRTT
jgi:hypothetical protein